LERTCRVSSGKDPFDLSADPFTREARRKRSISFDRRGCAWLYRQVEARNKANRSQHAQRVFNEAFGWIPDSAK
jgi:hypothetical protein